MDHRATVSLRASVGKKAVELMRLQFPRVRRLPCNPPRRVSRCAALPSIARACSTHDAPATATVFLPRFHGQISLRAPRASRSPCITFRPRVASMSISCCMESPLMQQPSERARAMLAASAVTPSIDATNMRRRVRRVLAKRSTPSRSMRSVKLRRLPHRAAASRAQTF